MLDSVYYTSYKQSFRGIITVGRSVGQLVCRSFNELFGLSPYNDTSYWSDYVTFLSAILMKLHSYKCSCARHYFKAQ